VGGISVRFVWAVCERSDQPGSDQSGGGGDLATGDGRREKEIDLETARREQQGEANKEAGNQSRDGSSRARRTKRQGRRGGKRSRKKASRAWGEAA
jgi:hypothetical protein